MKLYSNKTVANYILGNDLEGFDVDALEDNVEFMIDVMKMSSDKEMYNLCSDKVKSDPSFVSFIINHFSKDTKFVMSVADEFLAKSDDDIAKIEVLVIMTKILSDDSQRCLRYAIMLFGLRNEKETMVEAAKYECKDNPEQLEIIGETGFSLLYDDYKESVIVTDYFASNAIEKILHTDSAEFEDLFHRLFKSKEDLDNVNMRTFLIDYIYNYDHELASYISSHVELLNDTLKEISSLKNRWDTYPKRIEVKKYNMMFESIHRYMEDHSGNCSYTEDELLYSIGKELGIARDIYKYDTSIPKDDDFPYEEAIPDTSKLENGVMAYNDLVHYNYLKELIMRFTKATSLKELEDLEEEEYSAPSEESTEINSMLGELEPSTPTKKGSNVIDFRSATKK